VSDLTIAINVDVERADKTASSSASLRRNPHQAWPYKPIGTYALNKRHDTKLWLWRESRISSSRLFVPASQTQAA
jgi:hypothetical protein